MGIPREAGRITNSNEIRTLRNALALSDRQKQFLVGTLLGDGGLNTSFKNYRLVIQHSVKQQAYVNWKYNQIRNWTLSKPSYSSINKALVLRTVSHPELTEYYHCFYRNGKKVVPKKIGQLLDPFALAVWYMDDGNIRRQHGKIYGYYLNTQSFTYEENRALSQVLKEKFSLESYVLKNKGSYRLYFGSKSKLKLPKLIESYIIPSLQYKIR